MAELAPQKLTEHESYWALPLSGFRVIQLRLDYAFGMEIGDVDSVFSLRLNITFELKDSEGVANYSVERLAEIGPALRLFNSEIVDAKAFKNGRLEVTFSTNTTLSLEPDHQFEAWEVVSNRNGMRVVSTPGGELAIWSGTQT
jgi:hypothetical protein